MVNQVEGTPWATPIPLEPERNVQRNEVLVGPIAKANAQGKSSEETPTVLGIFNGLHACTSSSFYQEEEVPTWNYSVVYIGNPYNAFRDRNAGSFTQISG
ncbi:MAG: FMN-binding negative transcriptional regulator [Bacteroidota bacterium]